MPDTGLSYAGFWRRAAAQIIDAIVFLPLNYLLPFVLAKHLLVAVLVFLFAIMVYYVAMLSSKWQATLGKRLMKIYVVTRSGEKPPLKMVIYRFLLTMVPALPALVPSIYVVSISQQQLAAQVNSFHFQHVHELVFAMYVLFAIIFAAVAVLLLIWYVPVFFTSEKKGVHDMLCGTRVVIGRISKAVL